MYLEIPRRDQTDGRLDFEHARRVRMKAEACGNVALVREPLKTRHQYISHRAYASAINRLVSPLPSGLERVCLVRINF